MVTNSPGDMLRHSVIQVLKFQVLIAAILVAGSLVWFGPAAAAALAFGAALGGAATLIGGRSVRRSSDVAMDRPGAALVPVFSGVLQKLLIVAAGVVFGLKILELDEIFVLSGLAAVQLAYPLAAMPRFSGDGLNIKRKI